MRQQTQAAVDGCAAWSYVRMKCGHAIALEAPDEEAGHILNWVDELETKMG
jgi:hypothetical protein